MNAGGGAGGGPRGAPRRAGEHELDEHGADTVLYYARAGDLEGVRRMVEADPVQVCIVCVVGVISIDLMGWLDRPGAWGLSEAP